MRRIRRTEVTIETDEIVVIRSSSSHAAVAPPMCPQCCDAVPMITPEQATEMVSNNIRAIYRLVEAGRIHNIETAEGLLFVCPRSLFLAGLTRELPGLPTTEGSKS